MLLGLITGILNKYIGAYFEDIDASQLTGSIFGGGVTLNNISFRPSILTSLGIPFHVVAGKCGKLEIKYSLTRLYSEPIVVVLKDLHILVIPARGVEYNEKAEEEAIQAAKMRQLEIFESVKHHIILAHQRKAKKAKTKKKVFGENKAIEEVESMVEEIISSTVLTNAPQEATYFDMWVMQILRNIQFHIETVHIRFEDNITKPSEPFAVGLFLQNLQVHTTDSNWKSQYVKDYVPETSYKLVKIAGLSVYWNPAPTAMYKGIADKATLFHRLAATPRNNEKAFSMFFEPVSTDLKVHITPFPDVIQEPFSKPQLLIETSLHELSFNASDKQFKDIIPFLETLDFLTKSHKYRKFRIDLLNIPYHGHYKEWWKYAYNCILEDIERRRNNFRWSHILEYRQKCKKYLKAFYMKKVENKSTPEVEETILTMERELDLFMLITLRQQVEIMGARQDRPQQPDTGGLTGWVTSWFAYDYWFPPVIELKVPIKDAKEQVGSSKPKSGSPNFSVTELTPADKEHIRVAAGFAKHIDIVSYPEDYVGLEANVLLNQLRARVYRSLARNPETVLEGMLEKVNIVFRARPVDDGLQVQLKMGRLEMHGGDYPREGTAAEADAPPPIITTANPNVVEYFLKFMFEKNPLDSDVDQKLSFEGLALQFTYLADAIDRIAECFTVPPKKDVQKKAGHLRASKILRKVMQFRNSPTTKLLRLMENKGKIEINLCLITPLLVFPQDSTIKGKSNFVVVNLGEINLAGTLIGGTLCENGTCSHLL